MEIVSWTIQPDSTDPLIGITGRSGVVLTANIRNKAAIAVNNNIAAVASPFKNFKITAFLQDASGLPAATVGTVFVGSPTVSDAQLRQALPAVGPTGATTTFTGTIDYPALSLTNCVKVTHACLEIQADSVNGAIYAEGGGTLVDNKKCLAMSITCSPGWYRLRIHFVFHDFFHFMLLLLN